MRVHRLVLAVAVLAALGRPAATPAAPVPGVCTFQSLVNRVFAPVDLPFAAVENGMPSVTANVVIDGETGLFSFDGASVVVPPYDLPFADADDVFTFAPEVFAGTIDSAGSVIVPGVRFDICTLGTPVGTACVPSNLCSNDVSRICIRGAAGGIGCDPPGVCQGICRDDRSRSCATDADCGPGGFCGTGTLVPFAVDLTTGPSNVDDLQITGTPLDLATGSLTLADVIPTPAESPIIGDTGITSLFLTCTLAPIPPAESLPAPPAWEVRRGQAKLARNGTPGAADDRLGVKAIFSPLAGQADFASHDFRITLGTGETTLLVLAVPAGSLRVKGGGKRLTGVATQVSPPPGGEVAPEHRLKLRRRGARYQLTLASKGLDLDALADVSSIVTTVQLGFQSASATDGARTTRGGVRF